MVRLVFRPYTQIWRTICTSVPLRASTRVSSGFTLFRHSSPSFGSQQICSDSNLSLKIQIGRWCTRTRSHQRSLSLRARVYNSNTCIFVRLLGPCFKTGHLQPFRQYPGCKSTTAASWQASTSNLHAVYSHRLVRTVFVQNASLAFTSNEAFIQAITLAPKYKSPSQTSMLHQLANTDQLKPIAWLQQHWLQMFPF